MRISCIQTGKLLFRGVSLEEEKRTTLNVSELPSPDFSKSYIIWFVDLSGSRFKSRDPACACLFPNSFQKTSPQMVLCNNLVKCEVEQGQKKKNS